VACRLCRLVAPAIYLHRIREEEIALTEGLGDAYREYCRHTKRLIPWVYRRTIRVGFAHPRLS